MTDETILSAERVREIGVYSRPAQIQSLCASHEALRRELDDVRCDWQSRQEYVDDLEAENSRLRGLVKISDERGNLRAENAALRKELAETREQLPESMQNCTIRFNECEKGHGWLTATNWVQYGCPTCQRDSLRAECERLKQQLGNILAVIHRDGGHYTGEHGIDKSVEDAHRKWADLIQSEERLRKALEYFVDTYPDMKGLYVYEKAVYALSAAPASGAEQENA